MTNPLLERMGWVLVHSLWQFALLAALAAALLPALGRAKSSVLYNFLVVVLGLAACYPLATWFFLGLTPDSSSTALSTDQWVDAPSPIADQPRAVLPESSEGPVVQESPVDSAEPAFSQWAPLQRLEVWIRPWLGTLVAGWMVGLAAFSLRPIWGWLTLRKLATCGLLPAPEGLVHFAREQAARLRIRWPVRLHLSARVSCPLVVGYLRPLILLPVGLVSGVPCSQLEALVLHELAHIRRHDFVVNLAQVVVETLFFYHPAIWWLSHRIRIEREHCCDDAVMAWGGSAGDYGRALLAVEEVRGPGALLALGASGGLLRTRVLRLFGVPGPGVQRAGSPLLVLGIFLAGVSWLGIHLAGEGQSQAAQALLAQGAPQDPGKLPDMTFEEIAKKVEEGASKVRTGHLKLEVLQEDLVAKKKEPGQAEFSISRPYKVVFEYWLDGENYRRDRTIIQGGFITSTNNPIGKRYIHCENFLKKGRKLRDFDAGSTSLSGIIENVEHPWPDPKSELEDPRLIGLISDRMAFLVRFSLKNLLDGDQRKNGEVTKIVYQGELGYRLTWELEIKGLDTPGQYACVVLPGKNFGIVEFTGKGGRFEFTKNLQLKQVTPGIWFPEKTTLKLAWAWGHIEQETITTLAAAINQKIDPAVFRPEGMGLAEGKLFSNQGAESAENQSLIFYKGNLLPVLFQNGRMAPMAEYDKKYPNLEKRGGPKD